jgi:hypothetical protein
MADLKVGALVTACWTAHASKAAWWTAFRFHAPDPVDRDELVMGVMPPSTPEERGLARKVTKLATSSGSTILHTREDARCLAKNSASISAIDALARLRRSSKSQQCRGAG